MLRSLTGRGHFTILLNIYIPLNWSIIWSMAIITFIAAWNNFFWPFIVTNSTPMLTIPVGMTQVQSAYGVAFAKTSAIAVLASIPTALGYPSFPEAGDAGRHGIGRYQVKRASPRSKITTAEDSSLGSPLPTARVASVAKNV